MSDLAKLTGECLKKLEDIRKDENLAIDALRDRVPDIARALDQGDLVTARQLVTKGPRC